MKSFSLTPFVQSFVATLREPPPSNACVHFAAAVTQLVGSGICGKLMVVATERAISAPTLGAKIAFGAGAVVAFGLAGFCAIRSIQNFRATGAHLGL